VIGRNKNNQYCGLAEQLCICCLCGVSFDNLNILGYPAALVSTILKLHKRKEDSKNYANT